MKRMVELAVFVGVALAIHVVGFASKPPTGAESGGTGGDALISLAAAAPTVVEMVQTWETPPNLPDAVVPNMQAPPDTDTASITLPDIELNQAPRAQARMTLAQPTQTQTPDINTTPAAPPPPPPEVEAPKAPERPKTRPKPRPDPPETAQKSDKASAGRAQQRAAGSGGNDQAGASGASATSTASAGRQAKLQSIWGAKIRSRIERRKRFPSGTKGTGRVSVRLTVSHSGQLVSYRISKSSGVNAFDQAALNAVSRAGRFPGAPKALTGAQHTFNLQMNFSR